MATSSNESETDLNQESDEEGLGNKTNEEARVASEIDEK